MISSDTASSSVEASIEDSLSYRKRKRSSSNLAKGSQGDLPAPQPTKTYISQIIDRGTRSPSATGVDDDPSHSPILGKILINEDRLGSASPRSIAARQFSRLAIGENEQRRNELHPTLAPISDDKLPIPPPTYLHLDTLTNIRTEELSSTPPPKRVPPPRGIKSPRPKHRTSPFTPPSPNQRQATPPRATEATYPPSPLTPLSSSSSAIAASPSDVPLFDFDFDFDFRALTWQDSEITGHMMLDPDDDGTGLNGLGFRPTAATAVARNQRRRKQVLEWKARQAREERERRALKRRGLPHAGGSGLQMDNHPDSAAASGSGSGVGGSKKVVRFAV